MLQPHLAPSQDPNAQNQRLLPLDQFSGSLGQRVYQSLHSAIMSLTYRPGEILRKPDICDQLAVSRSPVSDAVARLASEGLVDVVPQAGTYVAKFSMAEIREGAFLREAIEVAAAEQVASGISDEQVLLLQRNLRLQEVLIADGDIAGFYKADGEMHSLILSFTGYRKLAVVSETAWAHVNRARRLILPVPGRVAATLNEHRAIVGAFEARDPVAARFAIRLHLRQLVTYLEPLERSHPDLFNPA